MARMNGGLAARGRRPSTGRQEEIARVGRAARAGGGQGKVNPQGRGMMNAPGQGNGKRFDPKTDTQNGLGRQLSRRVATGAITEQQAQRTAGERQTLKAKFGSDWRDKLGGQGAFAKARQMLTANPNNPKLIALNRRLQGRRQQLLEAARGGGKGNGGTTAPGGGQGKVNPRGQGMMNPPGQGAPRRRRRQGGGGY